MAKELIAFYSRADENYVNGTLQFLTVGNTETVAVMLQELTGADIFKIEQITPYSPKYNDCIQEAKEDRQNNVRPDLTCFPDSIDEYDVIYLGFPNYWSTMPMAVFTFLEKFDFQGKIIKPFCTHEGSGMGNSISDLKTLCPTAVIENGLTIYGSRVNKAKTDIERWIKQ